MTRQRAIVRQSLPQVIADDLRERILNGEIAEGEPIRQESLAEEYDVSRMPIREALKRLDAEGLVQLTNNRGATVNSYSLSEIAEIFDLRMLLEVDLFKRAIPRMTAAHIATCDTVLRDMERSYDTGDILRWGSLNTKFHLSLYAAAERDLTTDMLRRLNMQSERYVRMHLCKQERLDHAKKEHRELLTLAREGDVEAAADVLTTHILRTKDELLEMVRATRADT